MFQENNILSNALPCRSILCSCVSSPFSFCTHFPILQSLGHNVDMKFLKNVGKIIYCLFSYLHPTVCTTDGCPFYSSSCKFVCPSLKSSTHLHTIESLIVLLIHFINITNIMVNFRKLNFTCSEESDYRLYFKCNSHLKLKE